MLHVHNASYIRPCSVWSRRGVIRGPRARSTMQHATWYVVPGTRYYIYCVTTVMDKGTRIDGVMSRTREQQQQQLGSARLAWFCTPTSVLYNGRDHSIFKVYCLWICELSVCPVQRFHRPAQQVLSSRSSPHCVFRSMYFVLFSSKNERTYFSIVIHTYTVSKLGHHTRVVTSYDSCFCNI